MDSSQFQILHETRNLAGLLGSGRWRKGLAYAAIAGMLLLSIALLGDDVVRHIDSIEAWIARLGPWGLLAFIGVYVLATSAMMPESVLSIIAGALFGLAWGLEAVVVGSALAAALQYALSLHLLRHRIERFVATKPSFTAIEQAVRKNELKLQLLLRLTPLNPATVSYFLGATGVRFFGFFLASFATFPHLLLEVYFGFAGKHLARMTGRSAAAAHLHDAVVIGGLIVSVFVIVLASRYARKALMEAMPAKSAAGTSTTS
jgi:uncharacterized membrane protein YdjX (TVP38/TMEM64 family)